MIHIGSLHYAYTALSRLQAVGGWTEVEMANFIDIGQTNSTLYIQNLNERISPAHLRAELSKIFGEFGPVVDVVIKRRVALRGQAFILFHDTDTARKALESMQGERLYGKSMIIKYAKYKSDFISKADGTYEIERRRREQDKSTSRTTNIIVMINLCVVERAKQPRMTRRQILAQMASNPGMMMQQGSGLPMAGLPMPFSPPMPGTASLGPQMVGGELQLPNKILYLQNLPENAQEAQLSDLFKRYPGFVEIRLVPNRPDVAFAEYETEMQAIIARKDLDNHELVPNHRMRVAFARR